jgi:hypothetical protein
MSHWVRCTLESGEQPGEQKLVRHLNLDYYVRMERNPNNTTLLRGVGERYGNSRRVARAWNACSQPQPLLGAPNFVTEVRM